MSTRMYSLPTMTRLVRIALLITAVVALSAAPCASAVVAGSHCPMQDCGKDAPALSNALPCCCAGSGTPAESHASPGTALAASAAPVSTTGVVATTPARPAFGLIEAVPASSAPLYILHTTFLM